MTSSASDGTPAPAHDTVTAISSSTPSIKHPPAPDADSDVLMSGHVTGARRIEPAKPAPSTAMHVRRRRSESHSPSRKRMRLSSPTFDDQVGEPSQDDINAFDCLDAQLSQSRVDITSGKLPVEDDKNPFRSDETTEQTRQTGRIHAAFTSASAIDFSHQPSDDAPQEVDHAVWFDSDSSTSFAGFSTAATAMPVFQRPTVKGGNAKSLFIPSAAALREAEEKMKKWQEEINTPDQAPMPNDPESSHLAPPSQATFASARNAFSLIQAPETPAPASSSRSTNVDMPPPRLRTSFQSLSSNRQPKPFKSPLIKTTPTVLPHRQPSASAIHLPLGDRHSFAALPSQTTAALSPLRPSSVANHAMSQKPLGFTPRHGSAARPKFVTPFKAGVRSSTHKSLVLENIQLPQTPPNPRTIVNRIYPPSAPSPRPSRRNDEKKIFNLTPTLGRRTLATSGLRPQAYSPKQLEDMGIDIKELGQVDLRTAPFYAFTTRSRSPPSPSDFSPSLVLGLATVLEELHARGCTLAKQAWVDNHWPLVLWKLAGMVALDPTSECDPLRKRWCWPEVIRQFMYRYERDLNGSSRPPLRLITTRDASAETPMVLCISDIISRPDGVDDIAAPVQTCPELEVTDGWYRLRARIDAPLARAIKKGKIKIGRKIIVAAAKLSAGQKEGSEILDAYDSNVLLLTGNSTHMAPWHAKLGFQRGPFIATLNSLTADGGNIAVMMLTVIKIYPIAYIEFVEDSDGQKRREGPHDAKEELRLDTQWKAKRESHASKLWSEYEKRRDRLLDCAQCLGRRAGSEFRPRHDDGPPDKVYDLYDALQEDADAAKSIISSTSREDAGWLARHIQDRAVQERDEVSKDIERELESICPPRDVKAFCVIVANDTRTYKYPSKRMAQITVWDVPGVSVSEGCARSPFVPGERYLVTNLVPSQPSAWMDCGEVYLSTRKTSIWTLMS